MTALTKTNRGIKVINFDFFKLSPRLGRIRYAGLLSFWFGLWVLFFSLLKPDPSYSFLLNIGMVITLDTTLIMYLAHVLLILSRRLNDYDFSSWWLITLIILPIGVLLIISSLIIPGTKGTNRFGDVADDHTWFDYLLILVFPLIILGLIFTGVNIQ